jgi:hypothetical protein
MSSVAQDLRYPVRTLCHSGGTSIRRRKRFRGPAWVILSPALWKRRFGADAGIVGRRIRLDGLDETVVGVLPAGFRL